MPKILSQIKSSAGKALISALSNVHDSRIKANSKRVAAKQIREASANFSQWQKLTKEQKAEIAAYWNIKNPKEYVYFTHEIMLNVKGEFDVRYCPHVTFRMYLDDSEELWPWIDKNYFERHQPTLKYPHAYVRNVNGYLLDNGYNRITQKEAEQIICANLPVIIKPTIDSGEGKNLRLISTPGEAKDIFTNYTKDYIVQKVIVQCDELKKMGNNSVNSFRVITALVDGKAKVLSSHLLCNTTDSIAVNTNTAPGVGVVIVKVDEDGVLADYGFYENAQRIEQLPNGFKFGGLKIPSFKEAVEQLLKCHESMPMLEFVGWDITIDEGGELVVIEWNQRFIEVYHSQLTNGPLFGEDTEYFVGVLKDIMKNRKQVRVLR